jgi:hypothetical protein
VQELQNEELSDNEIDQVLEFNKNIQMKKTLSQIVHDILTLHSSGHLSETCILCQSGIPKNAFKNREEKYAIPENRKSKIKKCNSIQTLQQSNSTP